MPRKGEQSGGDFDFTAHERMVAERYARLARYDAFDALVDMALDGVITMADAKKEWEADEEEWNGNATAKPRTAN